MLPICEFSCFGKYSLKNYILKNIYEFYIYIEMTTLEKLLRDAQQLLGKMKQNDTVAENITEQFQHLNSKIEAGKKVLHQVMWLSYYKSSALYFKILQRMIYF